MKRAGHLLRHALSTFEDAPKHPQPITTSSPEGIFTAEWLPTAREIERKAEIRHEKLEQKATAMLSVVAVVAPIIVSAIVYIATHPPTGAWVFGLAIVLGIGAMVAVLFAFIAALRTLAVRGHQEIFIGGLVDGEHVRAYDPDFRIRGMLWTAANRQAINDHIADFLRASQMFLGVAITLVLLMGAATLPFAGDRSPQTVQGSVALDSTTVEAVGTAMARGIEPLVRGLNKVIERLDSLPTTVDFDTLAARVESPQAADANNRLGGPIQ